MFHERTLRRHDMLDPIKAELKKKGIGWGDFACALRLSMPGKTKNQRLETASDFFDRGEFKRLLDIIFHEGVSS